MKNFLKNYLSTILFILLAYFFFINNQFYYDFLVKSFSITYSFFVIDSLLIFKTIIFLYIILLVPFYIVYKEKSKARIIIKCIIKFFSRKNYSINNEEKISILAWIVKLFFAPLMIIFVSWQIFTVINNLHYSYKDLRMLNNSFYLFFQTDFFWLILWLILLVDLTFFTIW